MLLLLYFLLEFKAFVLVYRTMDFTKEWLKGERCAIESPRESSRKSSRERERESAKEQDKERAKEQALERDQETAQERDQERGLYEGF